MKIIELKNSNIEIKRCCECPFPKPYEQKINAIWYCELLHMDIKLDGDPLRGCPLKDGK